MSSYGSKSSLLEAYLKYRKVLRESTIPPTHFFCEYDLVDIIEELLDKTNKLEESFDVV